MIELEEHAAGLVVPVRARAGARRNGIDGEQGGRLKVSVAQAPEKGKANKAILEILADALGLRKSRIELLSGETSCEKRFLVMGASRRELELKLAALSRGKPGGQH